MEFRCFYENIRGKASVSAPAAVAPIPAIAANAAPATRMRAVAPISPIPPPSTVATRLTHARLREYAQTAGTKSGEGGDADICQHAHAAVHPCCAVAAVTAIFTRRAVSTAGTFHKTRAKEGSLQLVRPAGFPFCAVASGVAGNAWPPAVLAIRVVARGQNTNFEDCGSFAAGERFHLPQFHYHNVAMHLYGGSRFHRQMIHYNHHIQLFAKGYPLPVSVQVGDIPYPFGGDMMTLETDHLQMTG